MRPRPPDVWCAHGDPLCPCQDGLACHYEDAGGTPAMAPPFTVRHPTPAQWDRLRSALRALVGLDDDEVRS